jgi:hypothetical protein
MPRTLSAIFLLMLAGCAANSGSSYTQTPSPCAAGEATYACQIERYQRAPG